MSSVSFFLLCLALLPLSADGRFGDMVTDKNKDILFRDMGQAYVANFGVVDTRANLKVVLEDTAGVNELWVVDFQPYDKYTNRYPINLDTGNIEPGNTGACSNIIFEGTFSSALLTDGYYFKDDGNFININVTKSSNGNAVDKRLFEYYIRGDTYSTTDKYGNPVELRDDVMQFTGNFGYFFNCTDTDDQLIWQYSNTTDSVEYRTTMYLTNVRPRDITDGTKGVSWVTSSVDLIYRIYRVAIVNFVISSSALVAPTLNYLIIKPYPPEVLEPEPAKAWIKMEFETLIESPAGELLYYIDQSLNYTSREGIAELNTVLPEPDSSSGRESCDQISGRCRQTWTFYLVLDLTGPLPLDDTPIDATGTFSFDFEKHVCADSTATNPNTGCTVIPDIDFTISLIVTIQTVVSLLDETVDEPTIILKSLQGSNGEDLRGGALSGRRGVNHRETVTMVVGYAPELLHQDFDLQLTLFMVCKENAVDLPGGCLDKNEADRFVSYYHDDFKYIHTPEEGEVTTYELEEISDEWNNSADANPESQQTLESHGFNGNTNDYTITFINTALSQARLTYTITTVYKLVDVAGRRRRDAEKNNQVMVNTAMVPYGDPHTRQRRDLETAATYPQGHMVTLDFVGCPPYSTFDQSTLDCVCRRGEIYSETNFACEKPPPITKPPDYKLKDTIAEDSSASIFKSSTFHVLCLLLLHSSLTLELL